MRQDALRPKIEVPLAGLGAAPPWLAGSLACWLGATFQFGAKFDAGLTARTKVRMALGRVTLA